MRIQIRILLSIGISLLISAAILLAVFLVLQGMATETARGRVFGEIKNKISDLNLSVSRFPNQPYPSRIRQITDMQRSLEERFQTLTAVDQREESLIRSVRASSRELRDSVEKLISGSMAAGSMSPERYNVILSQLWMKTQFISDDTDQLLGMSQSRVKAAQKNARFLTLGLIIALIVINAALSFFFGKRIAKDQESLQKTLAKAEEGDRMLTALMDHVPEGITISDKNLNLIMVSRHGLGLLGIHQGLSAEEVAKRWRIYRRDGVTPMPVEDLPVVRAVRHGETVKSVDLVQVNDQGQRLPLLCNAAPIRDVAGNIVGGIVAWRDISDRKHAEEALRAREVDLNEAQRLTHIGSWHWDAQTDITTGTDELLRIYGFDPATQTIPNFKDQRGLWYPPEEWERLNAAVQEATRTGAGYDLEVQALRNDRFIWVQTRSEVLCDAQGRIVGLRGTVQDITERKRAEEALRQRAEEVERLLAAVPAAVWVAHDPQCLTIIGNRRANEFYEAQNGENVSATTLPGARRFFTPEGRELPAGELPMQKAVAGNQDVLDTELYVELPSGRRITMLGSAVPLRDPQGNARGCIGAFMDITDRKKTEEDLKASLSEKEVLLKEIHHRVKNNMQVISSLVDLQADEVKDPAVRAIFQDVIYRVRSMAMVHEKLYQSPNLARVDFADYAQSLLAYLWRAQGATASGIQLDLNLTPVSLSVNAAVPCGLILNELFSNALKHAFKGRDSGKVIVSLCEDAQGMVRLGVRDNGIGFPPQMDWEQSSSLGLGIVKTLTRQLNAKVEVKNTQGTEFTLQFER
jgi:PAS domain S-box-containing protein